MKESTALRKQVRAETKAFKSNVNESVSMMDMKKHIHREKLSAQHAHRQEIRDLREQVAHESATFKAMSC